MNWSCHVIWSLEHQPEKRKPINKFVMEMKNHLRTTYTIVTNQLRIASDWMKTPYDKVHFHGPAKKGGGVEHDTKRLCLICAFCTW